MLLHVRRHLAGDADPWGDRHGTYGSPVPWEVRGVAPGSMRENNDARDASLVAWTVYADKSSDVPTERDIVVKDGVDYTVEGRPEDWTLGPWDNPQAGVVVELRRVEG